MPDRPDLTHGVICCDWGRAVGAEMRWEGADLRTKNWTSTEGKQQSWGRGRQQKAGRRAGAGPSSGYL